MTESQRCLLSLLSKGLFGRNIDYPGVNWKDVLEEAKCQAVVRVAFEGIDKKKLDEDSLKMWESSSYLNFANSIKIFHNHHLLHQWMTECSIPYVVLKGCSSAYYYPVPEYRAMGDVDYLVPQEYVSQAGSVLEKHGLTPWDEEHIAHIVFRKPGMHYELHYNVAGIPEGRMGDVVREYMIEVFEQSQVVYINNGKMCLPSKFHHGLIILLHSCHHMTGEGIGLRHICDWAVFENSLSNKDFCDLFEEKLKDIGMWEFARVLTQISIKYLGADYKEFADGDYSVADNIMEDVLKGGNFGRKDEQRTIQTLLISNRGKNGVGNNSMAGQFFKSANSFVYHQWPITKKIKILMPVGWVFFGCRRVFREITGKRSKTNVKKLVDDASNRRELYKQLHIFEGESQ